MTHSFPTRLSSDLAMKPETDAAVSYYGVAIQARLDQIDEVRCPLLLHLAEDDHLCPPEAQEAIERAAAGHADGIHVMRHPGVGHAFARLNSQAYVKASAEAADAAPFALLPRALGVAALADWQRIVLRSRRAVAFLTRKGSSRESRGGKGSDWTG